MITDAHLHGWTPARVAIAAGNTPAAVDRESAPGGLARGAGGSQGVDWAGRNTTASKSATRRRSASPNRGHAASRLSISDWCWAGRCAAQALQRLWDRHPGFAARVMLVSESERGQANLGRTSLTSGPASFGGASGGWVDARTNLRNMQRAISRVRSQRGAGQARTLLQSMQRRCGDPGAHPPHAVAR